MIIFILMEHTDKYITTLNPFNTGSIPYNHTFCHIIWNDGIFSDCIFRNHLSNEINIILLCKASIISDCFLNTLT